ncbi:MAG: hypothetical protein LBD93_08560 [Treponema sp.]|jgi:hypothetical protein|nr:hypothetical protein [Treponema sp.]
MKKMILTVIFISFVSISSYSIGLTFGPIANEQYIIENDRKFQANFYDFPLFIGGIYHKINFSNKLFYYVDLAFDIHKSKTLYSTADVIDTTHYFLYFHNDINYFPFNQRWVYIGAGMELIVIDRIFSEEASQAIGYNYYISTNYFCYIDGGVNIPIGKIEIGFKMLYRILPFSIYKDMGNGEITFLIGLK